MSDWKQRVEHELSIAQAAQARGNEGMARVCARRAAGWTVRAWLEQRGIDLNTSSVLDPIHTLLKVEGLRLETRNILEHMLVAKQKDNLETDSYFPLDADLVAEARRLVALLFP